MSLSHLDDQGVMHMVDVGPKDVTRRRAVAATEVRMKRETLAQIRGEGLPKGDALAAARVAGILAAKRVAELIPLCHPLGLEQVDVRFQDLADGGGLAVEVEVRASAKTGVEMEALCGAAVAALTLYDMAKGCDPAMEIHHLRVLSKTGGTHDIADSRCRPDRE